MEKINRAQALEKCRMQIEEGKKRGRDAMRSMALALIRIRDERLYEEDGCDGFNEYVQTRLNWDRLAAWRVIHAGETIIALEAGEVDTALIPNEEHHLVLLHQIPAPELPQAWIDGLRVLEQQNKQVTTANIKRLVKAAKAQIEEEQAREEPRGVNPPLTIAGEAEAGGADGEPRKSFSEAAEVALQTIGEAAGDDIKRAIEKGTIKISERDLLRWADEDPIMIKNLAYYIVNEGWSLNKALEYEDTTFDELTNIQAIARFAEARGGAYETEITIGNTIWQFSLRKK
jgi:hypothetical protein